MAVGDQSKVGVQSYCVFRQESPYGTNPLTATAATFHVYVPTKIGIKTDIKTQKLDQLSTARGFTHQVQLDKSVAGPIEGFLTPDDCGHFLINAMGGLYTFTSITSAGDHSISTGNFGSTDTITSLAFNVRKGDAHVWAYVGGVINSLKLSAAVGEPVKMVAEFVFQDSSLTTIDFGTVLSVSANVPFTYVDGTYRYDATEGSLTSSVAEAIQSFELEINNNLVTDNAARQLGTRILSGRPPAPRRDVSFKITQRFDTSTTFNRFIQNTAGAAQLFFQGESITAEYRRQLTITLPNVRMRSAEPVVESANEVLQSEIEFDVLVSGNAGTSTSREIGMTLRNARTSKY